MPYFYPNFQSNHLNFAKLRSKRLKISQNRFWAISDRIFAFFAIFSVIFSFFTKIFSQNYHFQPIFLQNDESAAAEEDNRFVESMRGQIGSLKGDLKSLQESDDEDDDVADSEENHQTVVKQSGGWFSMIKGLVGEKKLTSDDLTPLIEKMRDNLISECERMMKNGKN